MAIPNDLFSVALFPSTDFNKVNLDWIMEILKALTGGANGYILSKAGDEDFNFDWIPNTGGGGGTSNYNDLTNKPQIGGVTLSGNKTLTQLGITAVALGAYVKPSGGIPKTDLASTVQTSLEKADTALQSAPVSSVNSKTGAVVLSASDVGAMGAVAGTTAGQVLTWSGSAWVAQALPLYNGGNG